MGDDSGHEFGHVGGGVVRDDAVVHEAVPRCFGGGGDVVFVAAPVVWGEPYELGADVFEVFRQADCFGLCGGEVPELFDGLG